MTPLRIGLARRIVAAFVLMTIAVATFFSATLVLTIEHAEERLVSDAMNRELDQRLRTDTAPQTNAGIGYPRYFDSDGLRAPPPPAWSAALPQGLNEPTIDGETLHVMVREVGNRRLLMIDDAGDFERRENMVRMLVLIGALVSVVLSALLGSLLARHIMAPVIALAERVRSASSGQDRRLAEGFAADEVGRLAEAFDQTLEALHRALSRERLITSDISHELRNPLMVIASSCELLTAHLAESSVARRTVARIERASREMQEIVDTLLALARANHAGAVATRQVALREAVEEQLARWRPLAEQRGLRLTMEADDGDDAGRDGEAARAQLLTLPAAPIATVLSNLIRNALHYAGAGTVRICVGAQHIRVVDTGPGIPEQERDRLFQPFVRGDGSHGDGIGIGLSLVERICASQGWRVTLSANQPHGCIFRIDFNMV